MKTGKEEVRKREAAGLQGAQYLLQLKRGGT